MGLAGCSGGATHTPDWTGVPLNPSPGISGGLPAGDPVSQKVTYDFGVPAQAVTILNPTPTPNPAPQPSLPYLVGIFAVDRSTENPAYQRILFYFRGGFPSYQFAYVDKVMPDGPVPDVDENGNVVVPTPTELPTAVPLTGNRFVQLTFFNAQAHIGSQPSYSESPPNPTSLPNLRSAVQVSDESGRVRYGLGIDAPSQPPALRAGEATYADGAGGTFSVVWMDVRTA
jgi:hypothetical protein